MRMITGKGGN